MLLVELLAEVELDRHALEDPLGFAGASVDDGRDTSICWKDLVSSSSRVEMVEVLDTVDLEEPRFLLFVLGDVDLVHVVCDAQLLDRAGDFLPVGRAGRVPVSVSAELVVCYLL